MTAIEKKIVIDEHGAPVEVIVPWAAFCEIAEAFGWDLDEDAKLDLRQTRADLAAGRIEDFIPLR
jgi:hypothetical protein